MKSFAALALAGVALATPVPQSDAPEGCQTSRDGEFQISVVNVTSSSKMKRQLDGTLMATLEDGILKDQAGRTGSIVANHQWQFDNPVQENAISTSGFSICSNGSLAHGGSAVWHQCYSGGFYNIYDEEIGDQCNEIYLVASGSGPVTQSPDGQPQATTIVPPVTQISDGQPQATTGAPIVSQISDGQPQAPTSGAPVTQISDGQPQVPTGAPVTQISDGQPQVPTGAPITQISDGQPQAPTGAPVTQISDGQPQAPVATGNVTAPGNNTAPLPEFPGAATAPAAGIGAFAAAMLAMVAML